jgi:hypothetical protein
MTKKDYIKIAEIIKNNTIQLYDVDNKIRTATHKKGLIFDLRVMFSDDNKLFNDNKFIDACKTKWEQKAK